VRLGDYSDRVTVDQLDAALRAGAFEGVWHYVHGSFARRLEDPAVVAGIRARGWPQAAIDVPHLVDIDGAAAVRAAIAYGFGAGALLGLDVEAEEFDADPAGWTAAADRWCPAVRAAGLSPGVYGPDRAVSACATAADWIWRARPGMCDPAGPGLAATFKAGRRIVQCGNGVFAGLEMDVSYSQFPIGGDPMTALQAQQLEDLWNFIWWGRAARLDPQTPWLAQALAAIQAAIKPLDVDQLAKDLAQDLVAILPAGADAQAVATAVTNLLAARLQPPPQAQVPSQA
jgi:hypothetical protein